MARRNAVTLIEVLVAIFVMGIGMLALLALFPLGIMRMMGSIEADKCSQACRMATAMASFQGGIDPATGLTYQGIRNDPWVWRLDVNTLVASTNINTFSNPQWLPGTTWQGNPLLPADPDGPSYPIFVDPMGYNQMTGLKAQFWLTQSGNTIPRRSVSFVQAGVNPTYSANRWFTIQDDLILDDGTPRPILYPDLATQTPGTFNRDTRYAFALMLQRPRTADPSFVNFTVAVFNGRALTGPFNEYLYQTNPEANPPRNEVKFDPVANTITVQNTDKLPPARPGNWLLDASYVPSPTGPYATVNGNFYRIVSAKQNSPTSVTYEVQPSLRNFPATNSTNPVTGQPNAWQKVVFMEELAEVFEKGTGRLP